MKKEQLLQFATCLLLAGTLEAGEFQIVGLSEQESDLVDRLVHQEAKWFQDSRNLEFTRVTMHRNLPLPASMYEDLSNVVELNDGRFDSLTTSTHAWKLLGPKFMGSIRTRLERVSGSGDQVSLESYDGRNRYSFIRFATDEGVTALPVYSSYEVKHLVSIPGATRDKDPRISLFPYLPLLLSHDSIGFEKIENYSRDGMLSLSTSNYTIRRPILLIDVEEETIVGLDYYNVAMGKVDRRLRYRSYFTIDDYQMPRYIDKELGLHGNQPYRGEFFQVSDIGSNSTTNPVFEEFNDFRITPPEDQEYEFWDIHSGTVYKVSTE